MPAPAPPDVVDNVVSLIANGHSFREAARRTGLSTSGAHTIAQRNRDKVELERSLALRAWARNVRKTADANSRALAAVIVDEESRGSDKAQCARALWEPLRGPESLTIVGDVDASVTVSVDARKVAILAGDADARRARIAELNAQLGIRP